MRRLHPCHFGWRRSHCTPIRMTENPHHGDPKQVIGKSGPFFKRRQTWLVMAELAIFFGIGCWAPLGEGNAVAGLDPSKVRIGLGIFACVAFLWMTEAMPLAATALLVPVLTVLSGISDVRTSLTPFADPLIYVFFGGFALAAAMTYQGVDRWIAQSLVRLGRGRFIPAACLLFCGTAFLSMWMSNTATAAMMIPLALGILRHLEDGQDTSRNRNFLLLGLAYSASIGGLGTVIGSPPNGIAATQLKLSFADWLKFGIPSVLLLMPAMILLIYLVFRPSRGLRIQVETKRFDFTRSRCMTIAIFACTAACWVAGGYLGPRLGIGQSFDTVVALVAFLTLIFTGVVSWENVARGTDWGVLLLFGGGIALSAVLKDTGASLYLARNLSNMTENWSMVWVIAAVVCFVIFLTELSSNTAVAALLVPIFYSMASEMGMSPAKLIPPVALAASCAFMLPVATPPNAIVYGTGMVTQKSMMRAGLVLNLVFTVLLTGLSMAIF